MPNVNRQTIYQMGNVVNDVVRQATGRDPVQAISMDYVTVEQNTLMGIETQSGSVVTFNTPKSVPLLTLEAQIVAQQDLNGYDYPWPAGGGKNKFSSTMLIEEGKGLADDGTLTTASNYSVYKMILPVGNYIWSGYSDAEITSQTFRAITYTESDTMIELFKSAWELGNAYQAFTITEETSYVLLSIRNSYTNVQVEAGSEVTAYAPYSNICPITGFTGCNISVSGGDNPERIYPVEWETEAGTVYGGTIDYINGILTIEYGIVTMDGTTTGNKGKRFTAKGGSELVDEFFSDFPGALVNWDFNNDAHVFCNMAPKGTSLTDVLQFRIISGASTAQPRLRFPLSWGIDTISKANNYIKALYQNGTPVTYTYRLTNPVTVNLSNEQINTRIGENIISASTGDVTLSYYVYHDLL